MKTNKKINFKNKNKMANFISNQDFKQIKRKHSIYNRFVDSEFRPSNDSVFFTKRFKEYLKEKGKLSRNKKEIEWIRAKDIYPDEKAHFVLDKHKQPINSSLINESNYEAFFNTRDLEQGQLGNYFSLFLNLVSLFFNCANCIKLTVGWSQP